MKISITAMLFIEIILGICEITASNCSAHYLNDLNWKTLGQYFIRKVIYDKLVFLHHIYSILQLGVPLQTVFEFKISFMWVCQSVTAQQMYSRGQKTIVDKPSWVSPIKCSVKISNCPSEQLKNWAICVIYLQLSVILLACSNSWVMFISRSV